MCTGGRLLCDFTAGTTQLPRGLTSEIERCLAPTIDGRWVIWAYKVAFREGEDFRALTGDAYPSDAQARCRLDPLHVAPVAACTCGFHAVSAPNAGVVGLLNRLERWRFKTIKIGPSVSLLSVVLSGRILAFEYGRHATLFRAERQTVVRVDDDQKQRDDPSGSREQSRPRRPVDVGPVRLDLPHDMPETVGIADDAGFCVFRSRPVAPRTRPQRTPALTG